MLVLVTLWRLAHPLFGKPCLQQVHPGLPILIGLGHAKAPIRTFASVYERRPHESSGTESQAFPLHLTEIK